MQMRPFLLSCLCLIAGLQSSAQWAPPPELFTPDAAESLAWTAAAHSQNLATAPGVKATSPNAPAPTSAVAVKANDGNPSSEWASADPSGAILQIEFPAAVKVNGVSLVRDIAAERPDDIVAGAAFVIEASTDGKAWAAVADTGKTALRTTQWATLFPEREVRFLRYRVTRGLGRLGEMGAFRADLTQAAAWGWHVPKAAWRTPLNPVAAAGAAPGANLALAWGGPDGVALPQSLQVVADGAQCETTFVAADPKRTDLGRLYWHVATPAPAKPAALWLYFDIGQAADAKLPTPAGEWVGAGFQWQGEPVTGAVPGRPQWVERGPVRGWVVPAPRDGVRLTLSTAWDCALRGKPFTATMEIENGGAALQGTLRLTLVRPSGAGVAIELVRKTLNLAPGAKDSRIENLVLAEAASGEYLLTAQLLNRSLVLAEAQRPVYVAPVPRPGMSFGIYSTPYWGSPGVIAEGIQTAAESGFTEITGQYWGGGYSFIADRALRCGLLWNPTIEPIYNQNPLADKDPAAACTDPDGKRITWHPSTCYTHPEVAKRTEADAEQWLREIVAAPGFAGFIQTDDDVHLAHNGCFNASCRDLFKQVTGRDVPTPKPDNATQPKDMPPPGLIPDDQPWLQWYLFRCSHIRGNLAKIYMGAKNRVDPSIRMGGVRGAMQFPFYSPGEGEYPPLFDAQYDAPGSYAYLYWVRQMQDYIAHGALAAMGNRGKGRWMLGDFAYSWFTWILEKGGDDRWRLELTKSLSSGMGNLYPPGALNKEVWCMLAGGFMRLHMFMLPERGARNDLAGTEDEQVLRKWGARARSHGQLIQALQEPVRPVAILVSISTSAFTEGLGHSGVTAGVFKNCLKEHLSVDMIAEEEILAGGLAGRQVLLLPDLKYLRKGVAAAIEKWAAAGGKVIAETGNPVQFAGSWAVPRAEMAGAAARLVKPEFACDNPTLLAREFELDGVRYYCLVNAYTDRWSAELRDDPWVAGDNSVFTDIYMPRAQKARLRLPPGQAWDLFANRRYAPAADGTVELTIGGDDGVLLAIYPEEPARLVGPALLRAKAGGEVVLDLELRSAQGTPVAGGVPLQVTVTDPTGADSEYSQYALATAGKAHVTFRMARNDPVGAWSVRVRSLVGSAATTIPLRLAP